MTALPAVLEDLGARILFHAAGGLLAVDKPAGIPSTGLALDDPRCLQYWLMRRFGAMVFAIHQLDADTSGVNLFTLERRQVAEIKRRMTAATGVKSYLAICHGRPAPDAIEIDRRIGFLDAGRRHLGVTESGKPARTAVRVLDRGERFSLLDVRLFTGRTHQIRIHLAAIGHPLLGECWYRRPPCAEAPRQALHARSIRFEDGLEPAAFTAPLPDDFRAMARSVGVDLSRVA